MNEHSHVRIESPAFAADSVHVIELSGRETISQLFEFHAQVVSSDPAGLDVDAVIGATAALVFERGEVEVRRLGGIVAGIRDSMHEETGRMVYDLFFAPRAFRLGLVETYEIFMDVSVPDIVKKKLERAGLIENQDYEFRLTASYPAREFVVQYKETDLAFVSRLLEHQGVSFFFEHKEGVDILVLSDANSGFAPVVDKKEVPFKSRGERLGVFALESQTRMTPAQYLVKDYNYRTPQLALQASAPNQMGDGGHVMEYGAHFKNPDEGAQIAKIRAEELAASRTVLDGKSDRHGFSAGAMFLLEDHPRGDMELLLTEVHHRASTSALGTGKDSERDYENSFKAIPYKTPFRPARVTPRPRIHGVITGVIDAAAKGPYAELDAEGRYRVRFLFDAGEAGDGQASRLCRMAQPHGGGGFGMHFPLRSGVEVILTFVEGDPDRPIILGVVPNPQTPSPVTAGNGTRNVIRTGGGNEINIDDTAGAERIKMSTPRGKSVIQLGAPNNPTDGIGLSSEGEVSAMAKGGWNVVSPTTNLVADVVNFLAADDIEFYCTKLINTMAKVSALLSGAGNAGTLVAEMKAKWLSGLGVEELEKQAEEQEEKVDELEGELAMTSQAEKLEARAAEKRAEAKASADADKLNAEASELEAQARELHKSARETESAEDKKKQAEALDESNKAVKLRAKRLRDEAEKTWPEVASKLAAVEKHGSDVHGAVSQLVGNFSALAGLWAENAAWLLARGHNLAAESHALAGETVTLIKPLMSPAFVGGGDFTGALIGGVSALVASGMSSTVYSEDTSTLLGGVLAAVKSHGNAEIQGTKAVYVTSTNKAQIKAGIGVHVEATSGTLSMKAGGETTLTSAGKMTATTGGVTQFKTPAGFIADGDPGEWLLDICRQHMSMHCNDWGFHVKDKVFSLGVFSEPGKHLWISADEIGMKRGSNTVKLTSSNFHVEVGGSAMDMTSSNFNLKVGGNVIDVTSAHIKLDGTRLDLG